MTLYPYPDNSRKCQSHLPAGIFLMENLAKNPVRHNAILMFPPIRRSGNGRHLPLCTGPPSPLYTTLPDAQNQTKPLILQVVVEL
jgi:hypothetical protein